ncbi:CC_3452 family protein [Sphingomonas sp. RB1R13]|uniref:CC_3452 family protein n=1 Tax=Sphingomonas sp. RB1R13 TaxID=3096159 RepID=UPI002FCA1328
MHRFLAPLAALAFIVVPTAASATIYAAVPITHAPLGRIMASDISWYCGSDACQGSSEESRPLVLCQGLAARTGRLASFLADGRAFSPTELDRCNSRARGPAPLARAN